MHSFKGGAASKGSEGSERFSASSSAVNVSAPEDVDNRRLGAVCVRATGDENLAPADRRNILPAVQRAGCTPAICYESTRRTEGAEKPHRTHDRPRIFTGGQSERGVCTTACRVEDIDDGGDVAMLVEPAGEEHDRVVADRPELLARRRQHLPWCGNSPAICRKLFHLGFRQI